jgi:hypothetical protein
MQEKTVSVQGGHPGCQRARRRRVHRAQRPLDYRHQGAGQADADRFHLRPRRMQRHPAAADRCFYLPGPVHSPSRPGAKGNALASDPKWNNCGEKGQGGFMDRRFLRETLEESR